MSHACKQNVRSKTGCLVLKQNSNFHSVQITQFVLKDIFLLWIKEVPERRSSIPDVGSVHHPFKPERVHKSITKTEIKAFWPYCGMFSSVMQQLSRCTEGGWVSKHIAQQIGKEEDHQSSVAMHLTDCSDNRQKKHSYGEKKKMEKGCRAGEEGGKVKAQKEKKERRSKKRQEAI